MLRLCDKLVSSMVLQNSAKTFQDDLQIDMNKFCFNSRSFQVSLNYQTRTIAVLACGCINIVCITS